MNDNFSIQNKVEFKESNGKIFAEIQVFKKGKFKRPSFFGEDKIFNLGKKEFESAISNFNAGVPSREIPLNFQHNSNNPDPEISKAAGWFGSGRQGTELFQSGNGLFVRAEVNDKTREFIENEEFLFSSAEFQENFKDEKGDEHGFTVLGLALTNVPFLRNMNKNKLLSAFQFSYKDDEINKVFEMEEVIDVEFIKQKEQSKMATKFIELAGVETEDEALAYFTELKEKDGTPLDEVVALTSEVDSLKADKEAIQLLMQTITEKQNSSEIDKRKDVLQGFFNEFKIDAAQLETASKAYVEIDSGKVSETQNLYANYVDTVKSFPAREDLQALTSANVADGDKQNNDVDSLIEAYQKENKCSFTEAFDAIKSQEPEKVRAYENEV